ncbi:MAG: hypothetical protein MUO94_07230 [Thermoplasmata archaeon]|nr:hypothetical protein [Thermoplasmata archaeon]
MSRENMDAEELKEVLGVVSTEIPKLLEAVTNIIYNVENAENFGKSIATFFKQLRDAGMDEKQAYKLTQQYMSNMSIGGIITNAVKGVKDNDLGDEIGDEVEKAVKKGLKMKFGGECGCDGDD